MSGNAGDRTRRTGRARLKLALGAGSLSALAGAGVVFLGAGSAQADASSSVGQGSAAAQALQIAPREGSLAIGAILGVSLAGHTLNFARAQSEGVDLGAIGTALSADNCGMPPQFASLVPQPLSTESGQNGAAQGESQGPSNKNYFSNEHVLANDSPYAEADTTYVGDAVGPNNAYIVAGMLTKSWSGLVNGAIEAGAESTIQSINFDNVVKLNGLDWNAVYPLDGGKPTGTFSIGQVVVGGVALPTSFDLTQIASAVNTVLNTVGIELHLPQSYVQQGTQFVSPLEIDVVPNATRDGIIDPLVTALQPDYYQIANGLENGFASDNPPLNGLGALEATAPGQQLASALCQSDTPITVLDVTLAAFDGGGSFSTSFGGVNASTSPVPVNPFSLNLLDLGNLNLAGTSQFVPGTGALGATNLPASTPSSAPTAPLRTASGARLNRPATLAAGSLLAAGLGGLGLLALLIEGDRQMMRRAQRAAASKE